MFPEIARGVRIVLEHGTTIAVRAGLLAHYTVAPSPAAPYHIVGTSVQTKSTVRGGMEAAKARMGVDAVAARHGTVATVADMPGRWTEVEEFKALVALPAVGVV